MENAIIKADLEHSITEKHKKVRWILFRILVPLPKRKTPVWVSFALAMYSDKVLKCAFLPKGMI
jgi:hypothetical protein